MADIHFRATVTVNDTDDLILVHHDNNAAPVLRRELRHLPRRTTTPTPPTPINLPVHVPTHLHVQRALYGCDDLFGIRVHELLEDWRIRNVDLFRGNFLDWRLQVPEPLFSNDRSNL